ncbi:MAG: hypothetical protein GY757_28310 [bacterium]|nr:hypothetical protein [bacterium]
MIKRVHFFIIAIFVGALCFCSTPPEDQGADSSGSVKKYSVKELKEDFSLLRRSLEEGHGGLYRYTPKEEMDGLFDGVFRRLTKPMTGIEFHRLLLPVIATINDGHTFFYPAYKDLAILTAQPVMMPFKLIFIKGKGFLFRNYSSIKGLEAGGEVLSVNNKPFPEIIAEMLPLICSDAHVLSSKYQTLQQPRRFGLLYNLLYGPTTEYSIAYRPPNSTGTKNIKCSGINAMELAAVSRRRFPDDSNYKPSFQLEYRSNTPILTISTFAGGMAYPGFLKKTFEELDKKKAQNLIIDLRDNRGGRDEYGKILCAYLLDKPFDYYKFLELNHSQYAFLKHTNMPNADDNPENTRKNNRGCYDLLEHSNLGIQSPRLPTFKGKVYILLNGNSFSTTGECTSILHFYKRAVFVGEECGAGYHGNTSGVMPGLRLPNTQSSITVPLVRYTMAVEGYPHPKRGLLPDYPVDANINDLVNNKDTVLEYTLELIKKSKK